ncbi:MAG: dihydroneopterin aldolase [Flavobacteriales bacterium]|nr:dihydroneopterin aldolase [Flavobacteriales bacterium]
MHKISVHGLKIHGFHGMYPIEEQEGNEFELDIDISMDLYHAANSDDIDDTLDYSKIIDIAKREMAIRSKLLEHVALRLIKAIRSESGDINRVKVTIKKLTARIDAKFDAVSITIDG